MHIEHQWDEPSQTPHKYKSTEYVHIHVAVEA